ncbi:hypothetical protein [Cupriavidus necator]|uniref:hypothetical protein n=1 Tax=Cupriavidus necator TaxID=106590 RepID=UPI003F734DAF
MQRDANELDRSDQLAVHIVNFGFRRTDGLLISCSSPRLLQDNVVMPGSLRTATVVTDIDSSKQLSCFLIAVWQQFNAYPQHSGSLLDWFTGWAPLCVVPSVVTLKAAKKGGAKALLLGLLHVVKLGSKCFDEPAEETFPSFPGNG